MKLPIIINIQITESIDEHIVDWMSDNREAVLRASLEACTILCDDEEEDSIVILQIHEETEELDVSETLIAVVTVEREDLLDNLQECEEFFVEIEDYEAANRVLEYRNKLVK